MMECNWRMIMAAVDFCHGCSKLKKKLKHHQKGKKCCARMTDHRGTSCLFVDQKMMVLCCCFSYDRMHENDIECDSMYSTYWHQKAMS